MHRWVRTTLAFAVALAAWAVVMPARAATAPISSSAVVLAWSTPEKAPTAAADADDAFTSQTSAVPLDVAFQVWPWSRAPLCDDRAATMFAPAPQLQAPQTSIDVGDSPDDCLSSFLDDGVAHQGGDSRGVNSVPDAAMLAAVPTVPAAPHVNHALDLPAELAVPKGVHTRLDRPPRSR